MQRSQGEGRDSLVRVPVDNLPLITFSCRVGELDVIGDDVDVVGLLFTDQIGEDGADDRCHTGRNDDDGDVILLGECVEVLKARVEGDVCSRTNQCSH